MVHRTIRRWALSDLCWADANNSNISLSILSIVMSLQSNPVIHGFLIHMLERCRHGQVYVVHMYRSKLSRVVRSATWGCKLLVIPRWALVYFHSAGRDTEIPYGLAIARPVTPPRHNTPPRPCNARSHSSKWQYNHNYSCMVNLVNVK